MASAPIIEVLLATYNGRAFVREQIDSILNQDDPHLTVLARDDGSTDGTSEVLDEYARRFPNRFRIMPTSGINGGILSNFRSLMKASTADYVCFSDQDDVWLPDKVSKSRKAMETLQLKRGKKTPLLVFSDLRVVDEELALLHPSFWQRMNIDPDVVHDLSQLLVNPAVTGCTMTANRRLIELASRMPDQAAMHDSWLALLASTLGDAAMLREATVLYRQHGGNAIGVGPAELKKPLIERLRRSSANVRPYFDRWQIYQKQAKAFLQVYGSELPPRKRKILKAFLECEENPNRFVRVATFFTHRFYFNGRLSKIAMLQYLWTGSNGNMSAG